MALLRPRRPGVLPGRRPRRRGHAVRPHSDDHAPSPAIISQFLSLVDDPAKQPVYVHCIGGRHRTGVMTAIYRMTADGCDASHAFQEMKHDKFGAEFLHPEFKAFLDTYLPTTPAPAAAK